MPTGFLGMRGTGDWAANQVPESWAQFILYEYPNGSAPLFAMQSMFRKESVDAYKYHWWTKTLPTQAVDIAAGTTIHIDAALATDYVYATHQATHGIAGGVIYVQVSEAFAGECKPNHVVLLRDSDRLTVDVRGKVLDVVKNGASSYIAVKLNEADDNDSVPATYNLTTVDRVLIIGTGHPEGSSAPVAMAYDPVEYDNLTQIFRDTLDITRTAKATRLRTGDAYKEAKRECAELHSISIEKTAFWGQKYSGIGENGKPERFTQGLIPFIYENVPANVVDYISDPLWAGQTWLQGGHEFIDLYLAQLFRYVNSGEVMCLIGDSGLLAIQTLARTYGEINLVPETAAYGLKVIRWITPFGTVYFKTHPLFSHEATNQRLAVFLLPKNCKFMPLVGGGENFNTQFEQNMQVPGQHAQIDGYFTEGGWKFMFPNQFMVMRNLGVANTA